MKILDIPQSGKRGLYVSQGGRYGQISRTLVIPSNPRTASQMSVRAIFARVVAGWRSLQEAQRAAWNAAASGVSSASRLGQSGPLTGSLLFNKIMLSDFRFLRSVQSSLNFTGLLSIFQFVGISAFDLVLSQFPLFRLNAGTWKSADNPGFLPELQTRLPQRPGRSSFGDGPGA